MNPNYINPFLNYRNPIILRNCKKYHMNTLQKEPPQNLKNKRI